MILKLAYYGDPILRKKGARVAEINDEIRQLVADMVETMRSINGIGLAAPQVKRSLALFITEVPVRVEGLPEEKWKQGEVRVFINPKLTGHSTDLWIRGEGCLSIPTIFGEVERPLTVTVEATDLEGNVFQEDFSWLDARAIMHENDHINGILFIDRIHGKKRKEMEPALQMVKKKYRDSK